MKKITKPEVRKWIYSKNLDKELLRLAILKVKIEKHRQSEDYDLMDDILETGRKSNDIKFVKMVLGMVDYTESDGRYIKEIEDYIFNLKLSSDYKIIANLMVENEEEIEG